MLSDYEISYSTLQRCNVAGRLYFDWGSPSRAMYGSWRNNGDAALMQLGLASLTDDDITFIRSMDHAVNSTMAEAFDALVVDLPALYPCDFEAWVSMLLRFVPRYLLEVPGLGEDDTQEMEARLVEKYVSLGFAPPLEVLYILTLRSEYWDKQIKVHCNVSTNPFPECLHEGKFNYGHTVLYLAGDPLEQPSNCLWDDDLFGCRKSMLTHWQHLDEASGRAAAKNILTSFDILSRVAATVDPAFKLYIDAYDDYLKKEQV